MAIETAKLPNRMLGSIFRKTLGTALLSVTLLALSGSANAVTQEDATKGDRAVAHAMRGDITAAQAEVDKISDVEAREITFGRLATLLAAAGDSDKAKALASRITDVNRRRAAIRDIASELARIGDIKTATELTGELEGEMRDGVIAVIAHVEAATGNLAAAKTRLRTISDAGRRESALGMIAAGMARGGEVKTAFSTAAEITDTAAKVRAYFAVALVFAAFEKRVEALSAARAGIDLISKLASATDKARARAEAVQVYLRIGDIHGAAQQAEKAADKEVKALLRNLVESERTLGLR